MKVRISFFVLASCSLMLAINDTHSDSALTIGRVVGPWALFPVVCAVRAKLSPQMIVFSYTSSIVAAEVLAELVVALTDELSTWHYRLRRIIGLLEGSTVCAGMAVLFYGIIECHKRLLKIILMRSFPTTA